MLYCRAESRGEDHMSLSGPETSLPHWRRGLATLLDFGAVSHGRAALVLVVVCLLAFLPGLLRIPPIDREEARFAQAAKQMVESGDYVDIRLQDDVRYRTPPGIYWLQAAAMKSGAVLGVRDAARRIALYRVPSVIGGIGAVLLTYWAALAFVSRRAALLAAIMLASSIMLGVEARLAKTDAMLLLTSVAAIGAMGRAYLGMARGVVAARPGFIVPAVFWTALAGGIMLKGPLIVMFAVLAATALCVADRSARWLRELRPLPGLLWLLLLVAPWFVAIVQRSGSVFFAEALGEELLGRVISAEFRYWVPGFYLVMFLATFWPASVVSGLAASSIWRERVQPQTRFLLAWVVPSWIAFELAATKLPHFVLPLYPALAILIAARIVSGDLSRHVWLQRGALWWFLVPVIVGISGIVLLAVVGGRMVVISWLFAVAAIVYGFRAWWLYRSDGAERAVLRASLASILLGIAIYAGVISSLQNLFPGARVARVLRFGGCEPQVAAAGYHEPSLIFFAGTDTTLTDGAGAAEFLRHGDCRVAVVEAREQRSFAQRAEAIGLVVRRGPAVGDNLYSNGRPVSLSVFARGQ